MKLELGKPFGGAYGDVCDSSLLFLVSEFLLAIFRLAIGQCLGLGQARDWETKEKYHSFRIRVKYRTINSKLIYKY